jgi:hypothetical protein
MMRRMKAAALLCLLVAAACPAWAQLHKCVETDGQIRYSDRACPAAERAAVIVAPPIAEPTREDAIAAQLRRMDDRSRAETADLRRRIQEARPLPGPASLGGPAVTSLGRPAQIDSARCSGIRHEQRRARIYDPQSYGRTMHTIELQRLERLHCGG